jgi:hypothetical protein
VKLTYCLAKTYRERVFIDSGETLPERASVDLDATSLTPELRAHILRTSMSGIGIPESLMLSDFEINRDGVGKPWRGPSITLDAPAGDTDALRMLAEDAARWDAIEVKRQAAAAAAQARQDAQRVKDAAETERKRIAALADAEVKAARVADRVAWIATHGSEFLRKACGAGYDCQRRYVIERAALERPGFVVDFDDRAAWRDRSCPSEAALDLALAVGGQVVWLTTPGYEISEAEYWEPCEAVLIRQYLGQYDLIKQS